MLAIKVPLKEAEKAKQFLMKKGLLDKRYSVARQVPCRAQHDSAVAKQPACILFPVLKRFTSKYPFVEVQLKARRLKAQDLKSSLEKELSEKELAKVKSSLDVVGDIGIIEVANELQQRAQLIAKHLLQSRPSIKTVLQKGKHEGELRVQKLAFLAGEDTRETTHKENGVRIHVNVETVYFSPRLSEDRKRIAEQIKPNEKVLVMFSGCGVYPVVFAKKSRAKEIVGIELNPQGHRYAQENIRLNKVKNVRFYEGDVRKVLPKLDEKFDRILMPLPHSAEAFLTLALSVANPDAIIHFYDIEKEGELDQAKEKVRAACKALNRSCRVLRLVKCGQVGQRLFRLCVDAKVG
ncbi:MAG: class I SAM-dependent methyltransferase family protein [Nanoarchaeota archaeon]